ncbi:MAG: hypothetical protein Q7W13_05110 [Bacteroidia bacterium]|nr:hypothetical protein [Bacteroidia bacterium]
MTDEKKNTIANSFPDKFVEDNISVVISSGEFELFEKGVFAPNMDSKWHIFVNSNNLYLARSWTNICIYKIPFEKFGDHVYLKKFYVNRVTDQYSSTDVEFDKTLLLRILQGYLKREDLYVDPKLSLPLIKATVEKFDKNNEYSKSIGSNNVGLTLQIHNGLTSNKQNDWLVEGWDELKSNIKNLKEDEPLISLHLSHRQNKKSTTFYFDKSGNRILGQITMTDKKKSSS